MCKQILNNLLKHAMYFQPLLLQNDLFVSRPCTQEAERSDKYIETVMSLRSIQSKTVLQLGSVHEILGQLVCFVQMLQHLEVTVLTCSRFLYLRMDIEKGKLHPNMISTCTKLRLRTSICAWNSRYFLIALLMGKELKEGLQNYMHPNFALDYSG